jgi:hypothetical protein
LLGQSSSPNPKGTVITSAPKETLLQTLSILNSRNHTLLQVSLFYCSHRRLNEEGWVVKSPRRHFSRRDG